MHGVATANAMADGVLRKVLLGVAADVSNAGLVYAGRRGACLGINAAHAAKLGDAVRTLRPCVFATASGTLQNSIAGSIILDRWRDPAGFFREQMPLA